MDQAIENEIVAMLNAGMSLRAIAEEMGFSPQTIRDVKKRRDDAQGGETASTPKANTDVAIAEAYESGKSIKKILDEFGINRPKLYAVLAKFSIPTRQAQREIGRKRAMDEAVELYKQGVVIRKIVEDTGIHQPTLHAELAKRGVEFRRPRGNS